MTINGFYSSCTAQLFDSILKYKDTLPRGNVLQGNLQASAMIKLVTSSTPAEVVCEALKLKEFNKMEENLEEFEKRVEEAAQEAINNRKAEKICR